MYSTLSQARAGTLKNISSSCSGSDAFLALLNEASEMLLPEDWSGLVVPIHCCVRQGCVVFPRYVAQVRKINYCTHPIPMTNMWGDFMPGHLYQGSCGDECRMVDKGRVPTYSSILGDGRYVRIYSTARADLGKSIRIFGEDNNGQPLKQRAADGSWEEGLEIEIASPYGTTTRYIRSIDRVLLEDMQARVFLYAYNDTDAVLEDLAVYEPGETNPEYIRYQLHVPFSTVSVNALVKLRYIPARFDNDLILLPLYALKPMMQSIRFGEANDIKNKQAYEVEAIRLLNRHKRSELPDAEIPIVTGAFAGEPVYQHLF